MKIIVLGGGPAGEAAAKFATKQKAEVFLIEKEYLGGLCLNRGCIPTKALLSSSKKLFDLRRTSILKNLSESEKNDFWKKMKNDKDEIVSNLRQNLEKVFKMHGIKVIYGEGTFVSPKQILVSTSTGQETLSFDKAIIATGSSPIFPPPLDSLKSELLNSDKSLVLKNIPESMIIVGGGAIGCEFACLFHEMGTKIIIVEKTSTLIPGEDEQVTKTLRNSFEKRGIEILDSVTIQQLHKADKKWHVTLSNQSKISAEEILVCVGRKPNFDVLNLEKANVQFSPRGIEVDSQLQTSNPNIYAVGDVNGLSLLAHAGAAQGEIAASNALGFRKTYDNNLVPRCLYARPEVAFVGLSKSQTQDQKIQVKTQRFFFAASGRALTEREPEGFIQIVSDSVSGRILGAQIIGLHATEIIHIISVAIKKNMTREELREVIFAHPTLSEGIREVLDK